MSLLRPRDTDALRAELRHLATETSLPLAFGGEVHGDTLLLSEFVGTRTGAMRGLAVRPSAGLGGATVVARRPLSVPDYRRASGITHDYDGPVLSEGIRSILAVPVVVDGRARAVLYGAYRQSAPIGDRTAAAMVSSARRLGHELAVRDEVDRRLRLREAHLANFGENTARAEQIREVHAELRRLAVDAPSPVAGQASSAGGRAGRRRPHRQHPVDGPRAGRAGAGRAGVHQCRSGRTSFAETRNREELPAQRGGQAGDAQPPRGRVARRGGRGSSRSRRSETARLRPASAPTPDAARRSDRRRG